MYEIKRAKRLSQDFVLFVTARANLFTDHKISSQIQIFQNNFWANCRQFSNWLIFSFFTLMVIHAWCCDFELLLSRLVCKFAVSFHTFLRVTFHVIGTKKILFLHQVSLKLWSEVFLWLQQKFWIRTYLCSSFVTISLLIWHSLWVQPKYTWSRNDVGSPKSRPSMRVIQVGSMFSVLPASLMSSTLIVIVLLLGWQRNIPNLKLFPTVFQWNFLKLPFP